jgi:hypothetical protein
MGQDFQKAKNTTYPKLFAALPGGRTQKLTSGVNGPERSPIVEDFNRQDYRLTLTNDSVITLGSADSYERYAGAEFGAVWMDEPSHYGEVLHDLTGMITTRLRGVDGPKTQLWTLTGEGYNAAWEILEQRQNADGDPIGLNITVVRASVLDNPYATEKELKMFRRRYEGTGEEDQALHGGFGAATGLVYSNFSRETHVIDHADAVDRVDVTDGWRIFGYDAGWNDPRVLLEIGKTAYDQLVVLAEFHESESHVDDAIAWLADRPTGRIYAEHEPADIERFKNASNPVTQADKSIDAGIDEVRNRLERDGDDRPGLLVSDRCQHTIREFLGYKKEHVGTSSAEDHCLDSLRYAVFTDERQGGGAPTATANVGSDDGSDGNGGNGDNPIMDAIKQANRRQKRVQRGNKWK